jgi:hypothetical protein
MDSNRHDIAILPKEILKMGNCEKCKFKEKYDKNPRSILGRIWKWHIRWCPGWKSYMNSLPDRRCDEVMKKYHLKVLP